MALKSRKHCSLCGRKKIGLWVLTTDCTVCRSQWRAFYAGRTPVSPLMRAIAAEKIERVSEARKVRTATRPK